jgi:ABC-type branched-subunit amino acid transport system substrate-binding protein
MSVRAQDRTEAYANTPEEMLPYRDFHGHYKLFFAEPQPFLGAGREKAAPAGLSSVRIGFLGPLEGSADSIPGRRMLQGAMLAIEEANVAGGYDNLPYELVVRNDVGPWGASSNKFVELSDEKVWAVLGSIDGASTHIALRVALKTEVALVTTGSTDPTLTETRIPWLGRVNADDRQNGYRLADYIFRQMGHERVAVLRVNDRYGRTGVGEFRDSARRLGRPILFELRFAPGDTSFTRQLQRITDSTADAVVLWSNAIDGARVVRQMRLMGLNHPVYGADRLASEEFLAHAGPAAEGVVATHPFDPDRKDEVLARFKAAYIDRFGEEAESFAAHAYDGMRLIVSAIENAGLNRVLIRDHLMSLASYDGVTGHIVFDPTLNDVGTVELARVRNGVFVPVVGDDAALPTAAAEPGN